MPMREYRDDETVDFAIVGTGAGGGTLAARLAEKGFSVVAFDAGPFFRPLDDFASDETEQNKLYWTDNRIVEGNDWMTMGGKNSGKAVGGSTVHFAMVSLRFRPEWFKARTMLGYGADWPLDWREMWGYYRQAERALSISGPVTYPWGPARPRYPYRAHPVNAAGMILAKGCEAMGMAWTPTPLATVSAPRGKSPPCVYRGFCRFGCSTNAKQSALVVWIPRAIAAGAKDSRYGHGRARRDKSGGPGDRRALHPRGKLAFSEGEERCGRRLCRRDAAPPADVFQRQVSRWVGQFLGPGRQEFDDPAQSGRVRRDGGGNSLEQSASLDHHH